MAHDRVGDAGTDLNSVRRRGDGAEHGESLAPNHMRVAYPESIEAEGIGALSKAHAF
jgi:hypothetical protein